MQNIRNGNPLSSCIKREFSARDIIESPINPSLSRIAADLNVPIVLVSYKNHDGYMKYCSYGLNMESDVTPISIASHNLCKDGSLIKADINACADLPLYQGRYGGDKAKFYIGMPVSIDDEFSGTISIVLESKTIRETGLSLERVSSMAREFIESERARESFLQGAEKRANSVQNHQEAFLGDKLVA